MKKTSIRLLNAFSVLLLCAALVISFFSVSAPNAVNAAWDGTVAAGFASGSGTENNPYLIKTTSQMGYFLKQLASGVTYNGQHIRLENSLNMTGTTWSYTHGIEFQGTFNGNGYTITADCPLFDDIGENGTLKGLNYTTIQTTVDRSLLCDYNKGIIDSCVCYGDVYLKASYNSESGVICTKNTGTVKNCGAIGNIEVRGNDNSAYAAMIRSNSGTISNCFSALTVYANGSGKYSEEKYDPLTLGTTSGCYYNADLYTKTAQSGVGLTTAQMKSGEFLASLMGTSVSGTNWVTGSHGYPELAHCNTDYAYADGYQNEKSIVYFSSSQSFTLRSTNSSATIYYTMDGSDPTSSSTRKSVTSGKSVSITGDAVLTVVPYYNSTYGTISRLDITSLVGSGTASSPYQISTKKQLKTLSIYPDKYFRLVGNITFADSDFGYGGVMAGGWVPVEEFSGTLDGNGYAISNLQGKNGGLFLTNKGTVTSLRLLDHKLYKYGDYGAITEDNRGTITRCYVRSAFTLDSLPPSATNGAEQVGGIAAWNSGTISYCRNDGLTVFTGGRRYCTMNYVGGICGYNSGTLTNCINTGVVVLQTYQHTDNGFVGGIVGRGNADNCFSDTDFVIYQSFDYNVKVGGVSGNDSYHGAGAYYCIAATPSVSVQVSGSYISPTTYKYTFAESYNNCYYLNDARIPSDCPKLDFDSGWMLTGSGLMPQGVMDANGHCFVPNGSATDPTCAANGSAPVKCTICGKTETQTVSKLGHVEVADDGKDATCTETGLTEGSHCSRCGETVTAQTEISAKGHSFTNYVSDKNATCTADGTRTAKCDRCDATKTVTDSGSKTDHNYVDHICTMCGALKISEASFPDANFRNYILNNITGASDGMLTSEELQKVTYINVSDMSIEDLTGIEYFSSLTVLFCFSNQLTSLDISQNSALTELNCASNQLTSLDVSQNTALTYLRCASNQLTSLDVCQNTALTHLSCDFNQLTSLNVTQNTALEILYCDFNQLTSLDISQNSALTRLVCDSNQLTSLDVTQNTALTYLWCSSNQLTSLDVRQNTALTELNCSYNQLTSLDVSQNTALTDLDCFSNELTSLDVCQNTALTILNCSHNQLTSLDISQNTALEELNCRYNNRTVTAIHNQFDLSGLDGFSVARASNWQGGTVNGTILTATSETVTYTYDLGNGKTETFTLTIDGFHSHDYTAVVTDPTCTAEGFTTYTCECGDSYVADKVAALGHNEVTDKGYAATCTATGLTDGVHCDRCGVTLTKQEEIPVLGHNWDDGVVTKEPTEEETGIRTFTCTRCHGTRTETIPKLEHTHKYSSSVTAPTCTDAGYTTYTCKCGDTFVSDKKDALGHVEVTDKGYAATCTEPGLTDGSHCTRCGDVLIEQEEIPALGHIEVTDKGKDATCIATGLTDGSHCDRCGKVLTAQTEIPALGHSEVTDKGQAATCTATGLTEGSHCDRCGKTLVAQTEIPALGHNEVTDKGQAATCTATGLTDGSHCDRCGKVLTRQEEIPALGHDWDDGVITKEATEESTGTMLFTCRVCQDTKTEIIPELTHSHSYTASYTDPTCTEAGFTTYTCKCGDSYRETGASALGHNEVTDKGQAATCTEVGLTDGSHCDRCGKVITVQEEIPALGHSEVADKGKSATCTEVGLTDGSHCDRCGKVITVQEEIPALGHREVTDKGKDATCTEVGLTDGSHCDRCNKVLTAQEEIPALGHSWDNGKVTKEPTEEETGIRTFTCTRCLETRTEEIPTLDHEHKYTSAVTTPTCTEAGYTTYTCTCGHSYTEAGEPAKGHMEILQPAVAATCTQTGLTEGSYCNVCNAVLKAQEEIAALGHSWNDGVVTKEPTEEETGIRTFTCVNCDETRTEEIPCIVPEAPEQEVNRLFGDSRITTAIEVANKMKEVLNKEVFDAIIIANGDNFADALTGSYLANAKSAPILLYRAKGMELNEAYIQENLSENGIVYILGGTAAVPASVEETLLAAGYNVQRVCGDSRFDTNLKILETAGVENQEILICTGWEYADSLSASATGLPILMLNTIKNELTESQIAFFRQYAGNKFTIIGGTSAVSEKLEADIEAIVGDVDRVFGAGREETSVAIASRYFDEPDYVLIAYSRNFPDGLCGGPLAYAMKAPLMLINAKREAPAAEYVAANAIAKGFVLGGTVAVSDESVAIVFGG